MWTYFQKKRSHPFYGVFSAFLALAFILSMIISPIPGHAQVMGPTLLNLPLPGVRVSLSQGFDPTLIKGITISPDNPLKFDFIIDSGDTDLQGQELREESSKLIKYFLAALTVPEDDLWVNLSPYESKRIIPDGLGQTEMGRDMLAQDYLLKQLTASLIYPEDDLGKKFWEHVYKKAYELYGTTQIPLNTFNKIWILPEKAVIYEKDDTAFITQSRLKVMLEEDYLALQHNINNRELGTDRLPGDDIRQVSSVSSSIVKELIIPAIEREVNEGKNFALLRQIYHSMILATWYKETLKQNIINRTYTNQNKVAGVEADDQEIKEKIYAQYIAAFKKGVYDFIREDYDPYEKEKIPRKYFSGGLAMRPAHVLQRNGKESDVRVKRGHRATGYLKKMSVRPPGEAGAAIPEMPDLSHLHDEFIQKAQSDAQEEFVIEDTLASVTVIHDDRLGQHGAYYFPLQEIGKYAQQQETEWIIVLNSQMSAEIQEEALWHEEQEIKLIVKYGYSEREAHVIVSALQSLKFQGPNGELTPFHQYQLQHLTGAEVDSLVAEYDTGALIDLHHADQLIANPSLVQGRSWHISVLGAAVSSDRPEFEPLSGDGIKRVMEYERGLIAKVYAAGLEGIDFIEEEINGLRVFKLFGFEKWMWSASISPDGKRLVTGMGDGALTMWNVTLGKEIKVFLEQQGGYRGSSFSKFSPDGKMIVAVSSGGIKVWDAGTGELKQTLETDDGVDSVDVSLDGEWVVAGTSQRPSNANYVMVWNINTGKLKQAIRVDQKSSVKVGISPHGKWVVSNSGPVRMWEVATGMEIRTLKEEDGWRGEIKVSPDGKRIFEVDKKMESIRVWDAKTGELEQTFKVGHVRSTALSLDGKRIATATGKSATIWDIETGSEVRAVSHGSGVLSVSISADGTMITTSAMDGKAKVWDAETGELMQTFGGPARMGWTQAQDRLTLSGHQDAVTSVNFSPDGTLIATVSTDKKGLVWDAESGELQHTLDHDTGLIAVNFSSDGKQIVTLNADRRTMVWDAKTGEWKETLDDQGGVLFPVSVSPDGTSMVTVKDNTAQVWDMDTGQLQRTLTGHEAEVTSVSYSPDGESILTGSVDHTARLWDAKTGELKETLEGHTGEILAAVFSTDGKSIATASADKTVKVWDGDSATPVIESTIEIKTSSYDYKSLINKPGISALEEEIVKGMGEVEEWEGKPAASSGGKLVPLDWGQAKVTNTLSGHQFNVFSVSISPDGKLIVTGGSGSARTWHAGTGEEKNILEGPKAMTVMAVAFSRNGEKIVTGGFDGNQVKVWDAQSGELEQALARHKSGVMSVDVFLKTKRIVSGGLDNTVMVWDVERGELMRTLYAKDRGPDYSDGVLSVAVSPDETLIVAGTISGDVMLWETESGELKQTLEGHERRVNAVDFSPDGSMIATASDDGTAKVWGTENGELNYTLEAHEGMVNAVDFSPDGNMIATGGGDAKVMLWETESGERKHTLDGHERLVNAVSFSLDGSKLVTASDDGTAKVWEAPAIGDTSALSSQSLKPLAVAGNTSSDTKGGIDFDPNYLEIESQGEGVDLEIPVDPQVIDGVLYGLTPVIIQITPITNSNLLFLIGAGREEKATEEDLKISRLK